MTRSATWLRRLAPRRDVRVVLAGLLLVAALAVNLRGAFAEHVTVAQRPASDELVTRRDGMVDFRTVVFYAGQGLRDGVNPYDLVAMSERTDIEGVFPLYGPGHLVLLAAPISLLPLEAAEGLWWALSAALLVVFAVVCLRFARLSTRADVVLGLAALLALSMPGHAVLNLGQVTLVPALGAYLAWRYADRDRPVLAGIGLAIALFKATIGLPVLVLLLLLGRWRPLAVGFGLTAVPGLVVAVTGLRFSGGVGGFVDALRDNLDRASSDGNNRLGAQLRIDLPSLVNRLTGVELPSVAEWAMFAVILGVTAGFVVVAARRGLRIDDPPVCIVVAAATVLSLASQNYNVLLLAWPLLALLAAPTASLPPVGRRVLRVPAGAVALLLMVPPRTLVRALSIPWLEVRDVTSLLSGLVVALAAAAAVVTLRLPRQPVRPDTDGERGAPTGDERDELVLEPVGT